MSTAHKKNKKARQRPNSKPAKNKIEYKKSKKLTFDDVSKLVEAIERIEKDKLNEG